jgi:transcriptional regulator with XRE-family HTH domain
VDAYRLGTVCRALRIRRGWRQEDLAKRAGATRSDVSRIECGRALELRGEVVVQVAIALGGRVGYSVTWQGGELDRLLNARHSALHETVARFFRSLGGWELAPEVSYSVRGERGIIDILAWHATTRTLLVIELKTEVVDVNELMGKVDQKQRLAAVVVRDRGWIPARVAAWVIVGDSAMNRRRVQSHATTLRAAFPADGRSISGWLQRPDSPMKCLSFWTNAPGERTKRGVAVVRRVRKPAASTPRAQRDE